MSKKLLSLLLAVLMVISVVPVSAFAQDESTPNEAYASSEQELLEALANSNIEKIILTTDEVSLTQELAIGRSVEIVSSVGETTINSAENRPHILVDTTNRIVKLLFSDIVLDGGYSGGASTYPEIVSGGIYTADTSDDIDRRPLEIKGAVIKNSFVAIRTVGLGTENNCDITGCIHLMRTMCTFDYPDIKVIDSVISGGNVGIFVDGEYTGANHNIHLKNVNIHHNQTGLSFNKGFLTLKLDKTKISENSIRGINMKEIGDSEIKFTKSSIVENGFLGGADGGGIYVEGISGSQLTLETPVISRNNAGAGGAIRTDIKLIVTDGEFDANRAAWEGAGLYCLASGNEFYGTRFTNNVTTGGSGGAIFVQGPTITDEYTYFEGNRSAVVNAPYKNSDDMYPNIGFSKASIHGHPVNDYDILMHQGKDGVYPTFASQYITSADSIEGISVPYGTDRAALVNILNQDRSVGVTLNNAQEKTVSAPWTISEIPESYDGNEADTYTISSIISVPYNGNDDFDNRSQVSAEIEVTVNSQPIITSVESLADMTVPHGTTNEALEEKLQEERSEVIVWVDELVSRDDLQIVWSTDGSEPEFDGETPGRYTVYGAIDLEGTNIGNPDVIKAEIEVEVLPPTIPPIIVSIDPEYITVDQNIPLAPVDSDHAFGVPSSADAPSTVTAHLASGAIIELPVDWDRDSLDSSVIGEQTILGDVIIEDGLGVSNPNDVKAQITITVLPAQYEVWVIETGEPSLEVLCGTTLEEIEQQLRDEGVGPADVLAYNLETQQDAYLYANLLLSEDDNVSFTPDIPGSYSLTASLAENFIVDYIETIIINVTVLPPLEIIEVETAYIDTYQSVAVENIDNAPEQVNVTLENGMVIPIDVDWNWDSYSKDSEGQQFITGILKNIPCKAVNSAGYTAMLVVDVEAVDYEVIEVISDNSFVFDAGFTLDEITQALEPTLNLKIQSVGREENFTTEYEVGVVLSDEENADYAYDYADIYLLKGDLQLPLNISYDDTHWYDEIFLETMPVEVVAIEPVYLTANDGTYFEDIPGLANKVSVTLSNGKTTVINVAWEAYLYRASPSELTEENPVEQFIHGELVDYPQYVNITLIEAELIVTTVMVYYLDSISSARFPFAGVMDVDLGSSIDDIYNALASRTVELSLVNRSGSITKTVNVTFELREEDNEDYDAAALDTYTLKAYLPLADNILNPNNLGVEIFVKTTKYTISSTTAVRLTGVAAGTPFNEIGLPEKASATLNNARVVELDTNWNGDSYLPGKIGSQVVRGTFATPYPLYVENPNNRQPNAMVTIVNAQVTVVSMEQIIEAAPMGRAFSAPPTTDTIEGFTEIKYKVELLHEDGTTTNDIISVFAEK